MARKKPELPAGVTEATLDALVAGFRTQAEFDVVFQGLKKALTERILRAELREHLGYPDGAVRPADSTNARNETTPKTVLTESGALPLEIPRDRESSFAPLFVPKDVHRLPEFDQKLLPLYARGLTVYLHTRQADAREHGRDLLAIRASPLGWRVAATGWPPRRHSGASRSP